MNPAVQALLDEIARAKKRAAEKKTQQAATQQTQYGILHIDGHLQLRLPPPPPKPSKEDCCQTGCTPCILDTYAEQHRAYEKTVDALTKQFEKAQKGEEAGCEFVHPHTALPGGLLDPLRFIGIPVRRTQDYGARSRLLVLEATSKEFVLSLGEHIHLRIGCRENGWITKPFTPVMIQDSDGIVRPHVFVRLYPGNPMSRFLSEVQQGTTLMVRGPVRTIENMTRALACPGPTVLVAGGSGIAPV
ncbi:NADH-cytochrome b5 reductase-like, partial [Coemansia sp. RSA 2598]